VTIAAYTLAILLSLAIIFIGARFVLAPQTAAAGYGVPAKEHGDPAYLSVKSVRDVASGVLGLALMAFTDHVSVGVFMLVLAIIPLGDMLIVLRNGGTRATAFGVHFATAVVMLIDAALLFAS
jgi:hypothetical protein